MYISVDRLMYLYIFTQTQKLLSTSAYVRVKMPANLSYLHKKMSMHTYKWMY